MELVYQFWLALTYLLNYAPYIPTYEHVYTASLLTYECGYKNDIKPLIGAIIVQHESGAKPTIVNKEGNDTGLMQVQPPYAFKKKVFDKNEKGYYYGDKIATKNIKKGRYTQEELKNPRINIKVGCWILGMWKKGSLTFNGEKKWYIAHYASGPNLNMKSKRFQNWVIKRNNKWKKIMSFKEESVAVSTPYPFSVIL